MLLLFVSFLLSACNVYDPIDIEDTIFIPVNDSTENWLIQSALVPHSKIVLGPGIIHLNQEIQVAEGVSIQNISIDPTTIIQNLENSPVFSIVGDDVSIIGLTLETPYNRIYDANGAIFGASSFVYSAGVWSNMERGLFQNLKIKNFTCGINLASWSNPGLSKDVFDNTIDNVFVEDVDFGLLAMGQKNLSVTAMTGHISISEDSPHPPHLIYISDAWGEYSLTENFIVDQCVCLSSPHGHAYQVKGAKNGIVQNCKAYDSKGLLSVKGVEDVFFLNMESVDDIDGGLGSLYFQSEDDLTHTDGILINTTTSGRVLRLAGHGSTFSNITVIKTGPQISNVRDAEFFGSGMTVSNIHIDNENSTEDTFIALLCEQSTFNDISANNCKQGVQATSLSANNTITISEDNFTTSGSSFYLYSDIGQNNTFIIN